MCCVCSMLGGKWRWFRHGAPFTTGATKSVSLQPSMYGSLPSPQSSSKMGPPTENKALWLLSRSAHPASSALDEAISAVVVVVVVVVVGEIGLRFGATIATPAPPLRLHLPGHEKYMPFRSVSVTVSRAKDAEGSMYRVSVAAPSTTRPYTEDVVSLFLHSSEVSPPPHAAIENGAMSESAVR